MNKIRVFSLNWLSFCIGGLTTTLYLGCPIWWAMLVLLAIGELPYIICKVILFFLYCQYRNEYCEIVDDYPSWHDWQREKARRRASSKFSFLYE